MLAEDRVGPTETIEGFEEKLLERQVFRCGLDHNVCLLHGGAELGRRLDMLGRGRGIGRIRHVELGHAPQIDANALDGAGKDLRIRIGEANLVASNGKLLGDPVAHEPGADYRYPPNLVEVHELLLSRPA